MPEEVEEQLTEEEGGGRGNSVIPGEILHQNIEGIEVLDHWAEANGLAKLEIQNNRDETFKHPEHWATKSEPQPIIRGRVVTSQGNQLGHDFWVGNTAFGPGKINAGTSAVIGLRCGTGKQNAARYELCLYPYEGVSRPDSWDEACGNQTPTPTFDESVPGPGSNKVIHNGVTNLEVTRHELVDNSDEDLIDLEIDLGSIGLKNIKDYYVAVQWFTDKGNYYPPDEPMIVEGGPDRTTKKNEAITITVTAKKARAETYEICIGSTNNEITTEKVIATCNWPRDG